MLTNNHAFILSFWLNEPCCSVSSLVLCTHIYLHQDNGTVASGPCPSCGAANVVFFGSMLGVKGNM